MILPAGSGCYARRRPGLGDAQATGQADPSPCLQPCPYVLFRLSHKNERVETVWGPHAFLAVRLAGPLMPRADDGPRPSRNAPAERRPSAVLLVILLRPRRLYVDCPCGSAGCSSRYARGMSRGLRDGTDFGLARVQAVHPERSCGCIPRGDVS